MNAFSFMPLAAVLALPLISGTVLAEQQVQQASASARTEPVARIIGGNPTYQENIPWQALVYIDAGNDGHDVFQCGGVIIDKNTVLTAAHCIIKNSVAAQQDEIFVWAGITSTDSVTAFNALRVTAVDLHPGFNEETFINDIALLRLGKDIPAGAQPIQLATVSEQQQADTAFDNTFVPDSQRGQNLLVSGWGRTSTEPGATSARQLQHALLAGVPDDYCEQVWGSVVEPSQSAMFVCAMSPDPAVKRDTCQGDSGGPLVWQNPQASADSDLGFRLVGLVSFGAECGADFPAVYTEVSHYRDWIALIAGDGFNFYPDSVFAFNPFALNAENTSVTSETDTQNSQDSAISALSSAMASRSGGSVTAGGMLALLGMLWWRRSQGGES
ncbi:serine protease [Photobacterium sp. CAU 1568]|uniref:Serine protease n=1 Tax=Photobacterium arenosum TaxID=2774143 RepID=A0ABR9BRX6_9GAMM|nr:serine protease [Photobacterium arenosum]MBD8514327.1 serine protease [Photobacterium arenosum]